MDVARPLKKSDADIDVHAARIPRGMSKHTCQAVAVICIHLWFIHIHRRQLRLLWMYCVLMECENAA